MMKRSPIAFPAVLLALALLAGLPAAAGVPVTVDNFVRAETDMTFRRYEKQGAFGKFLHVRVPTPVDKQSVIRMNLDTLYSAGVFDLDAGPLTIIKPDPGKRFQSMLVINQDHSMLPVVHGSGRFSYTRAQIGTRYVMVLFRTFADPGDPADVKAANALQDRIRAEQAATGKLELPDWDEASLTRVRDAILVLASTKHDASGMFGDKSRLNPIDHLIGTAMGWGGNPKEGAMYFNAFPKAGDGKVAHVLRLKDVPVDGFWSVTVYNAKGFMEKNDRGLYAYNNVTARKDPDGGVTIRFGGDPKATNYLPIMPGWNYTFRAYQPRREILEGRWQPPEAVPAN
jgi:hypothetical protein